MLGDVDVKRGISDTVHSSLNNENLWLRCDKVKKIFEFV